MPAATTRAGLTADYLTLTDEQKRLLKASCPPRLDERVRLDTPAEHVAHGRVGVVAAVQERRGHATLFWVRLDGDRTTIGPLDARELSLV